MEKPIIEIDGKKYEMIDVKARMWRLFAEFDEKKKTIKLVDFVDEHAKILAVFFKGLTADDILDNMPLGEILNTYRKCSRYLIGLLNGKFETLEKNAESGEVAAT